MVSSHEKKDKTALLLMILVGAVAVMLAAAVLIAQPWSKDDSGNTGGEFNAVTANGKPLPSQPEDQNAPDPAIGSVIPALNGFDFKGDSVAILPDGKPKVVVLAAHWCPHCQKDLPLFAQWITAHPNTNGVAFYAVSTGANKTRDNFPPSAWFSKSKWTAPVLVDNEKSDAGAAYGLRFYPMVVFVDANNKVVLRHSGEYKDMTEFEKDVAQITPKN